MMKVDINQIVKALDKFDVFGPKKRSSYEVVVSNRQLSVINWKTNEIAYLGKTLESAIKLKNLLYRVEATKQARAVEDALEELVTETGEWV